MGNNTIILFFPAESYASFTVPGSMHFFHQVKVINPANNKSVSIQMELDTGAETSMIYYPHVQSLGINLTSGRRGSVTSTRVKSAPTYTHNLQIQIGNLKPITLPVLLHTIGGDRSFLGWRGLLNNMKFEISGKKLTYTEIMAALAMSSFSSSSSSFNKYRDRM
jgi:hypothetical protein